MFYWLIEDHFYYSKKNKVDEDYELLVKLEKKLLGGHYKKGEIHYYPVVEERLFKTQVYILKKNGLQKN